MVVHDGAVPKTVIGIRTSTVIMAFVSQFLKWNCTVKKKQNKKKITVYQLWLGLCCLLTKLHISTTKICIYWLLHSTLLQSYMIRRYTSGRLNCSSMWDSLPRANWNVTLYPVIFFFLEVFQDTIYCRPPFSSRSGYCLTRLAFIPPCSLFSFAAKACLHFSLYFSYRKPPSWKKLLHKKILQQSILRLSRSVIQYGCHSWDLIKVNACGE